MTPQVKVTKESVIKPDYAIDGDPRSERAERGENRVQVLSKGAQARMRSVGRLAGEILQMCGSMVQPGVTPDQIDRAVHAASIANDAYPSPLNYRGFPKSVCVSVNEVIW